MADAAGCGRLGDRPSPSAAACVRIAGDRHGHRDPDRLRRPRALAAGAVLLRMPTDPVTPPVRRAWRPRSPHCWRWRRSIIRLRPNALAAFLLVAPWRYALTPLVVHFALEVGWAHRRQRWTGWVLGWYAIQLGLFLVVGVGLSMDEVPAGRCGRRDLPRHDSRTARRAGCRWSVRSLALTTPARGRALRRPLLWTLPPFDRPRPLAARSN